MLRAVNLSKAYDGKSVLENFTMEFAPGGRYALMGPSGCGKTTLLRLLMGLEKPDGGRVEGLEGLRLSAVFQENRLLEHLTAPENVEWVCDAPRGKIEDKLLALGLERDSFQKPVAEYSGGMKRRVALCRALMAPWDTLFLDEPYKGLDDDTKARAMALVEQSAGGGTVVLVTHDTDEARGFQLRQMGRG